MTNYDQDHHARMAQQFEPTERALRAYRRSVRVRDAMVWVAGIAALAAMIWFAVGALV